MDPQYEQSGTVSLKGNDYEDPKFYCKHFENSDGSRCFRIFLTTESDLQLDYVQTAGYVDNMTIMASISDLTGFTMIVHPFPPNS